LVDKLAERLELDGEHLGSDSKVNLTGRAKGEALVRKYGRGGFDYVGDAPVDLKVWKRADLAYVVAPSQRLRSSMENMGKPPVELEGGWRPRDLLKALRPHQWIKNILLLMPMIAAHQTDILGFEIILAAIVAFSFAASSIYIVNDLLDLDSDRQHEKKFARPFAAGKVPIKVGAITSIVLGVLALTIAALIGWEMLGVIAVYRRGCGCGACFGLAGGFCILGLHVAGLREADDRIVTCENRRQASGAGLSKERSA